MSEIMPDTSFGIWPLNLDDSTRMNSSAGAPSWSAHARKARRRSFHDFSMPAA